MEDRKKTNKKMIEPITETPADTTISITVDGVKYYYLYVYMDTKHSFKFRNPFQINGLGSVTELIDEDENVVNRYRYTPFGEALYKEEQVFNPYQYTFRDFEEIPNVGRIAQQFQQTGRRYDNETGQYYYRARMYSPVQGRFLSADPLGMVDGPNMYMYVRNDPVNARDPSGRWNPDWGNPMLYNGWGGPMDWAVFDATVYGHTPGETRRRGNGNGAECVVSLRWWGYQITCNEKATEEIYFLLLGDITGPEIDFVSMVLIPILSYISLPTGLFYIQLSYLRNTSQQCFRQNQKLRINQPWTSTPALLQCVG